MIESLALILLCQLAGFDTGGGDLLMLSPEDIAAAAPEADKRLSGAFDPAQISDRYEEALAELITAKAEGRKIPAPKKRKAGPKIDLMEALRKSAAA